MTVCAPVSPEKGPRLQLQVCPQGRLCRGSRLSKLGCTSVYPALPAPLLGLGSSGLMESARPLEAAAGGDKALHTATAS